MQRLPITLSVALIFGCGDPPGETFDAALEVPITEPATNEARGIASTSLSVNVDQLSSVATIVVEPSSAAGATFEIGDIEIDSVTASGTAVPFIDRGDRLDIGLGASESNHTIDIAYRFKKHTKFDGYTANDSGGFTLLWPYYCGNLFPCHSRPDDGTEFSVTIAPPASGKVVVAPTGVIAEAPSYQVAWAIGDYTRLELGTTNKGTRITVDYLPNQLPQAQKGTANLKAAFEWLENTMGPYRFGNHAGTVAVRWGAGALGGMEHHPLWHLAVPALADEETNVHEAVHGWYGDGIRIACWEDFVLSEGTTTYLAGRALDVVAPTVGAAVWDDYARELPNISPSSPVWPTTCNKIDIIRDNLFTRAPYIRGAFFYRAVALKVGADKLDAALAAFYAANAGKAATMQAMLTTIANVTGFDPTACANAWLRSTTIPPVAACQ